MVLVLPACVSKCHPLFKKLSLFWILYLLAKHFFHRKNLFCHFFHRKNLFCHRKIVFFHRTLFSIQKIFSIEQYFSLNFNSYKFWTQYQNIAHVPCWWWDMCQCHLRNGTCSNISINGGTSSLILLNGLRP